MVGNLRFKKGYRSITGPESKKLNFCLVTTTLRYFVLVFSAFEGMAWGFVYDLEALKTVPAGYKKPSKQKDDLLLPQMHDKEPQSKVRYINGVPVFCKKGEKFITETIKEDWDGGSKGKRSYATILEARFSPVIMISELPSCADTCL
eukprot:433322-Pelagomonas_calceolata.AAC.2